MYIITVIIAWGHKGAPDPVALQFILANHIKLNFPKDSKGYPRL